MKKRKFKLLTLSAMIVASFYFAPSYAQNDGTAAQTPVAAEPASDSNASESAPASAEEATGGVMQMDAITVIGTRQKQKALDVPATVNVIERKEMDDHNVNNIEELIRYEPGIQVNRQIAGETPFGGSSGFTIRGVSGNRVKMVVDGSRVIESNMIGQPGNRDFVDLSMMKRVEIQRGPASTLWGADALGGVVSFQTLDPSDLLKGKPLGVKASYGWDGLNYSHTQNAMIAMQLMPELDFLVGYTHRTYSETRLRNARADGGIQGCSRKGGVGCDRLNPLDGESNNVLGKLVYKPNADHEFKLTGEYYNADNDVNVIYDKGQQTGPMGMMGDNSVPWYKQTRNENKTRSRVSLEHDWDVNSSLLDNVKWRLSYSKQDRNTTQNTLNQYMFYPRDYYRRINYGEEFYEADIQFTSSFDLAGTQHKLTYGFQGDRTYTKYDRLTVSKNLRTGRTTAENAQVFADSETTRADVYIQDEIKLLDGRWTITPGLRYAHYKMKPSTKYYYDTIAGNEPKDMSEGRWLPQVGTIFKLDDNYSVYARYAKGFKMPTAEMLYYSLSMGSFDYVPNPNLQPERVTSYEAGIRGKFSKGWFSLGYFYSDYTNFIQSYQQISATEYSNVNVDKLKLWGIEAAAEWQFADNWTLNAALTYQHDKSSGASTSIPAGGHTTTGAIATPLTGVLGVKWNIPEYGITTELVGTFSGGVNRNAPGYFKPGSYALLDGYVNWQISKNFRLNLALINILNKRYFPVAAAGEQRVNANNYARPLELFTGPGRTFSATLIGTF